MNIYVIGHKSPDLDSISSAIGYAEFLREINRYPDATIVPVRAGEPNKETEYILNKFGVEMPVCVDDIEIKDEDRFVLLDHNEGAQRSDSIKDEQVVEVVDHHKLNVNFSIPLRMDVRPVGSSATIVYELFHSYGKTPSSGTSEILLASILSDTVGLKSPTTTGIDVTIAEEVSKRLNIDLKELTFELFKSKSDLTGLSAQEIVNKDFKIFEFDGVKVFIGQVETVEPEKVLEIKDELLNGLEINKDSHGVDIAYLFITDIINLVSYALYSKEGDKEILEIAFTTTGENGVANVGPKISRKKDIAPAIENTLKSTRKA